MSITAALTNAVSGLRATARATQIVSSNLANATTPGYSVRSLSLAAQAGTTGGVSVESVLRKSDPALISDRRMADAENAQAQANSDFWVRLERQIGNPEDLSSLSARLSQFETSLISAASRPDSEQRLDIAVQSARDLANTFVSLSNELQSIRTEADREISRQVDKLNQVLQGVEELNAKIVSASQNPDETTAAFQDQRQILIDEISDFIPLREVARKDGSVALYSTKGAVLLDGSAAELTFEASPLITAEMSVGGALSGLQINGFDIKTDPSGLLSGGSLGAQFVIRDEAAPSAQTRLDAMARDLIERYQDPSLVGMGAVGLFTDEGAAFNPTDDEIGLAGRLQINPSVDPIQGGEVWRLRAGIGATDPGEVGDASLLQSLKNALSEVRMLSSGDFGPSPRSAFDLVTTFLSDVGASRQRTDQLLGFTAASLESFTQAELSAGVDTDAELQQLLVLEQAYAANARVIQAADEMLNEILRI